MLRTALAAWPAVVPATLLAVPRAAIAPCLPALADWVAAFPARPAPAAAAEARRASPRPIAEPELPATSRASELGTKYTQAAKSNDSTIACSIREMLLEMVPLLAAMSVAQPWARARPTASTASIVKI